jgi:hypothetical protein
MNIIRFNGLNAKLWYYSLRLNEFRTNPCEAILNARRRGQRGGGQDCMDAGVRAMQRSDVSEQFAEDARSSFIPFMQYAG